MTVMDHSNGFGMIDDKRLTCNGLEKASVKTE